MKQKIISLYVVAFMTIIKGYCGVIPTVPDITIIQGDTSNVVIYFEFGESAYTAYQFDIAYPEGINSLCDEEGNPLFIKGDVYGETHNVSSIYTSKGLDRFQCFSLNSEPFTTQSGILLNLPIKVPESMAEGKYQATISPIEFVQTDATPDIPETITFNINVAMPIHIEVQECDGGHIEGLTTGVYAHHADLHLTAVPDEEFLFQCWLVNDKPISEASSTLSLRADSNMTVKALFVPEFYTHSMKLEKGWNWVSSYISEAWPLEELENYTSRIVGQSEELINDPQYGIVGGLKQMSSGVSYKLEARESFTTNFRGHLYSAPVVLKKGWNWVAYPWTESRPVSTTITNADEGDYLISQHGFTEYVDGYWEGNLTTLTPGEGYLYKSSSDKILGYCFSDSLANGQKTASLVNGTHLANDVMDIYAYPNTMNVTARLYQNGMELTGNEYVIYAISDDEIRGVGEYVGSNYYLTVYGDQSVDINFLVEDTRTGETFWANEKLTFHDDVVGSRRQPFTISISEATGIVGVENGMLNDCSVYDIEGRKINTHSSSFNVRFKKGIYIINGRKIIKGE